MTTATLFIHEQPTDYHLIGDDERVMYERQDAGIVSVDALLIDKIREWYVTNDLAESERAVNNWAAAIGENTAQWVCEQHPHTKPLKQARHVVKALLRSLHIPFATATCPETAQFTIQTAPFAKLPRHQRTLAQSGLRVMLRRAVAVVDADLRVKMTLYDRGGHIVVG